MSRWLSSLSVTTMARPEIMPTSYSIVILITPSRCGTLARECIVRRNLAVRRLCGEETHAEVYREYTAAIAPAEINEVAALADPIYFSLGAAERRGRYQRGSLARSAIATARFLGVGFFALG